VSLKEEHLKAVKKWRSARRAGDIEEATRWGKEALRLHSLIWGKD
jgi:hypothetical protein